MSAQAILLRIRAVVEGQQSVMGLQGALNGLNAGLLNLSAGLNVLQQVNAAIGQMVGQAQSWADAANKAATDARVFEVTVKRFGVNADEANAAAERLAQRFGMSAESIKGSMTTMMRVGFTNMQQLEVAMTGAAASSLAAGKSAAYGFEQVADAAATGLSTALNGIGISENLAPAYDKLAKSLGKTKEELTDTERAFALTNMIAKATGSEIAVLGEVQNQYVRSKQALTLAEENFAKAMGELTMPLMTRYNQLASQLVGTMVSVAKAMHGGEGALNALTAAFPALSGAAEAAKSTLQAFAPVVETWKGHFAAAGAAYGRFSEALRSGEGVLDALGQAFPNLIGLFTLFKVAAAAIAPVMQQVATLSAALRDAFFGVQDPVETLTTAFPALARPLGMLGAAMDGVRAAINGVNTALTQIEGGANPLEALGNAFPSLAGGLERVQTEWAAFWAELTKMGQQAWPLIEGLLGAIGSATGDLLSRLLPMALDFAASVLNALTQLAAGINGTLFPILEAVLPAAQSVFAEVPAVVESAVRLAGGALETFATLVSGVFAAIRWTWDSLLGPMWEMFGPVVQSAATVVMRSISQVADVISGVFKALNLGVRGEWTAGWDAFLEIASRSSEGVRKALRELGSDALDLARHIGGNIKDGVLYGLAGLGDTLIQQLKAQLERFTGWMPDWVKQKLGITGAGATLNNASDYFQQVRGSATERVYGRQFKAKDELGEDILRQAFQKTGDKMADTVVNWCARWTKKTLQQAEPQAKAAIEEWFGGANANVVKNKLKGKGLLRNDWSRLKPGDVVLYDDNHIGIYVGKDSAGNDMVRGNNRAGVKHGRGVVSNEVMSSLGPRAGFVSLADIPEIAVKLNINGRDVRASNGGEVDILAGEKANANAWRRSQGQQAGGASASAANAGSVNTMPPLPKLPEMELGQKAPLANITAEQIAKAQQLLATLEKMQALADKDKSPVNLTGLQKAKADLEAFRKASEGNAFVLEQLKGKAEAAGGAYIATAEDIKQFGADALRLYQNLQKAEETGDPFKVAEAQRAIEVWKGQSKERAAVLQLEGQAYEANIQRRRALAQQDEAIQRIRTASTAEAAQNNLQIEQDALETLRADHQQALREAGQNLEARSRLTREFADAEEQQLKRVAEAQLVVAKRANEAKLSSDLSAIEDLEVDDATKQGLASEARARAAERNSAAYRAYYAAIGEAARESAGAQLDALKAAEKGYSDFTDSVLAAGRAGEMSAEDYRSFKETLAALDLDAANAGIREQAAEWREVAAAALDYGQVLSTQKDNWEAIARRDIEAAQGLSSIGEGLAALEDLGGRLGDAAAAGQNVGDALVWVEEATSKLKKEWDGFTAGLERQDALRGYVEGLENLTDAELAAAEAGAIAAKSQQHLGAIHDEMNRRSQQHEANVKTIEDAQARLNELVTGKSIPAWKSLADSLDKVANKPATDPEQAKQLSELAEKLRVAGEAADKTAEAFGVAAAKNKAAMEQNERDLASGAVSQMEYFDTRDRLLKEAADADFERSRKTEQDQIEHQARLKAIEENGARDRLQFQQDLGRRAVAAAQRLAKAQLDVARKHGMDELTYTKEVNALELAAFEDYWAQELAVLQRGSQKYLTKYAEYLAERAEMTGRHSQSELQAEISKWEKLADQLGKAGEIARTVNGGEDSWVSIAADWGTMGVTAYTQFMSGDVMGAIMTTVNGIGKVGDAIMNLDPAFQQWKSNMLEIVDLQRQAAGAMNYGGIANPYHQVLGEDAAKREKVANAGFWRRASWAIFGGKPEVMEEEVARQMSEAGKIFAGLAGDLASSLESEMMNAFESGDWAGAEEALNKSLDTFVAKAALQVVIAESKLSELIKAYAEARAAGGSGTAELEAIREEIGRVRSEFESVASGLPQHIESQSDRIANAIGGAIQSGAQSGLVSGIREAIKSGSTEGLGRAIRESVTDSLMNSLIDTFVKSNVMKSILEPAMQAVGAALATETTDDDAAAFDVLDKSLGRYSRMAADFSEKLAKMLGIKVEVAPVVDDFSLLVNSTAEALKKGAESGLANGIKAAVKSGSTEGLSRAIRESVGDSLLNTLIDTFTKSAAMKSVIDPAMQQVGAALATESTDDDAAAFGVLDSALSRYSQMASDFAQRIGPMLGRAGVLGPSATEGTITNMNEQGGASGGYRSYSSNSSVLASSSGGGYVAAGASSGALERAIQRLSEQLSAPAISDIGRIMQETANINREAAKTQLQAAQMQLQAAGERMLQGGQQLQPARQMFGATLHQGGGAHVVRESF